MKPKSYVNSGASAQYLRREASAGRGEFVPNFTETLYFFQLSLIKASYNNSILS